jgi:hypothetical protein
VSDFNFRIKSSGLVSEKFLEKEISDFAAACSFVKQLAYRRNTNRKNLLQLFSENCGTCSTKHALLKELANENAVSEIKLMLGIYKMNNRNTPGVGDTLSRHKMDFIPEAHNYLRINNQILDCTFPNSSGENFANELLAEIEITPEQIGDFKIDFHKNFLREWMKENKFAPANFSELWSIRESCIQKLSESKTTA